MVNQGNLVALSNLVIRGTRPDGTADSGADLVALVTFDPVGAGCDQTSGFCNPGADIQWYVNGQMVSEVLADGFDQSLGGYIVSSPQFTAPASGVITISVMSQNQLSASITVEATGLEPGQGTVAVTYLSCGNSPDYRCSCEANGELIVYFSEHTTNPGDGTAYVDVYVDGVLTVPNNPTSTRQDTEEYGDSVAIACPSQMADHVILVQGKNGDPGASVVLSASTPADTSIAAGIPVGATSPAATILSAAMNSAVTANVPAVKTGQVSCILNPAACRSSPSSASAVPAVPATIAGIPTTTVAIVGGCTVIGLALALFIYAMKNQ